MKIQIKLVCLCILFFSAPLLASGGYGGGSSTGVSATDPHYEKGKKITNGKSPRYKKIRICIKPIASTLGKGKPNLAVKLSSKHLKPFKRKTATILAKQLFSCNAPQKNILSYLSKQDALTVLYYLNTRYRLKLSDR
jgi:hypothetical protein